MVGALAHNDWLELLAGFGLVGLFIYVVLFFSAMSIYRHTVDKAIKLCIVIVLIMWFIEASVSMAYTSTAFQFLIMGGLCGISLNNRISHIRKNIKD